MGRGEKEGTTPVAVTDAFRINKFVNLISESDMTDDSAFFIANVNKHTNHYSNGVGIFRERDCAERLELRESRTVDGTSQSSRSAALAKRIAALGTIMLPNESDFFYLFIYFLNLRKIVTLKVIMFKPFFGGGTG